MFLELIITFLLTIASGIFLYKKWKHSYWKRKGIYTLPQEVHSQFSLGYKILRQKGIKFGGMFNYSHPYLLITDLDVIKCVFIKNFDHFINHSAYFNEKDDPLSATLENLENEQWKQLRSIITPAFSTGKIRY